MQELPYSVTISNCDRPTPTVVARGTSAEGRAVTFTGKDVRADPTSISYSVTSSDSGMTVTTNLRLERQDGKELLVGHADVSSAKSDRQRQYRLERQ